MNEKQTIALSGFMVGFGVAGVIASLMFNRSHKNFMTIYNIAKENSIIARKLMDHASLDDLREIMTDVEFERITREF